MQVREAGGGAPASGGARGFGLDWLAVALLWLYFATLPLVDASFAYHPVALILIVAAYGLLAVLLHGGARCAGSLAWPLGGLAALAVGLVMAWHWRETFNRPASGLAVAALAGGVGLVYWAAFVALRPAAFRRAGAAAVVSAVALATLVGVGYRASNDFRWHLLRHNRTFGTPAYYALSPPVPDVRSALWASHVEAAAGRRTPPPAIATAAPVRDGRRPNVVVVLIDTMRADSLAAYGGDERLMPRLNRLAEHALVLGDVQSNTSWTRPSVASLFTGLHPEEHGAIDRHTRLSESNLTLAEVLHSEGYRTAAFVSNFANVGVQSGFNQGFDVFEELKSDRFPYARAAEVTESVLGWLQGTPQTDAPLFLYVHYLDPHTPYLSGGDYVFGGHRTILSYHAELTYTDANVGLFLDHMRRALGPDTVLLVLSDHGEEFGDHGEGGHGHALYRELVHVPAMLEGPGVTPGRLDAPIEGRELFDLLLRLSRRESVDPEAWARAREKERGDLRYASVYLTTPSAFHRPYQTHVCLRSIEDGKHVLIWSGYGEVWELYDLASDPDERSNVYDDEPDVARKLGPELDEVLGPWSALETEASTDDTLDLLRDLGYVE